MQRTSSTTLAFASRRAGTQAFASSVPSSRVVVASRHFAEATPNKGGEAKEPSMLAGHAHYVTGAVKETVGSVIGSETMKKAGQEAKDAGVAEMKAAYHGQDNWMSPELEKKLGKAIGCEGMAEKGEEKLRKKHDQP